MLKQRSTVRKQDLHEVVDEVLELFMDLDASDEQLDCPFLYASAKRRLCHERI